MRAYQARPVSNARRKRSAARLCLLAFGIMVALSGCEAAAGSQTGVVRATPAAQQGEPDNAQTATESGSTADGLAVRVAEHLNSLAARTSKPDAAALRAAFVAAGAEEGSVEVSIDVTPTGLEVDAMTAAVPVEGTCVFGHIRDGVTTVTLLPLLADGQCFVGDQR